MKFSEFQKLRSKILSENDGVIDCSETNLYASLTRLNSVQAADTTQTVHRCHLATDWTNYFGLPTDLSRRALISCGVRDSLSLLFRHYAERGARVWLPADNYPVYVELARAAGLSPREFPTLPEPIWPDETPAEGDEVLVVTNPLKPLGRFLTSAEVSILKSWLGRSSHRRIILDTVYTFEERMHRTTLDLFATGQAIILHSLTKGWLHPRLFGVALVPENDAESLTPIFRAQPPPQLNLALARDLMSRHAEMPKAIAQELGTARARLLATLPGPIQIAQPGDASGYFMTVHRPWSELLKDFRVLSLPAAVFGSDRGDYSILSSLSFAS